MKKLVLFSTLILALVLVPIYFLAGMDYVKATLLSFILSMFIILFSYTSILWAFNKGTKVLYTTLFAGMAIRFVVLLSTMYVVRKFTQLPIIAFVLIFMLFYLVLQFQEIRLVTNELRLLKAKQSDK